MQMEGLGGGVKALVLSESVTVPVKGNIQAPLYES